MKKFVIWYTVLFLLFAVGFYFLTLTFAYNQRVYDVFYELADEAVQNHDFDEFVGMQSKAYKKLAALPLDDYNVFIYQTISEREGVTITQLGVFVLPHETATYATEVDDPNDLTGMRALVQNTNDNFYETYLDDDYDGVAVSYGVHLMDFYYYAIDIEADVNLFVALYDYYQEVIVIVPVSIEITTIDTIDDRYELGLTDEGLEALVDQETYVYPKLIKNMTIYVVSGVLLGSAIFLFLKYRKKLK